MGGYGAGPLLVNGFYEAMLKQYEYWQCRSCGYGKTSVLSEICEGCGDEDCNQGLDPSDPRWVDYSKV